MASLRASNLHPDTPKAGILPLPLPVPTTAGSKPPKLQPDGGLLPLPAPASPHAPFLGAINSPTDAGGLPSINSLSPGVLGFAPTPGPNPVLQPPPGPSPVLQPPPGPSPVLQRPPGPSPVLQTPPGPSPLQPPPGPSPVLQPPAETLPGPTATAWPSFKPSSRDLSSLGQPRQSSDPWSEGHVRDAPGHVTAPGSCGQFRKASLDRFGADSVAPPAEPTSRYRRSSEPWNRSRGPPLSWSRDIIAGGQGPSHVTEARRAEGSRDRDTEANVLAILPFPSDQSGRSERRHDPPPRQRVTSRDAPHDAHPDREPPHYLHAGPAPSGARPRQAPALDPRDDLRQYYGSSGLRGAATASSAHRPTVLAPPPPSHVYDRELASVGFGVPGPFMYRRSATTGPRMPQTGPRTGSRTVDFALNPAAYSHWLGEDLGPPGPSWPMEPFLSRYAPPMPEHLQLHMPERLKLQMQLRMMLAMQASQFAGGDSERDLPANPFAGEGGPFGGAGRASEQGLFGAGREDIDVMPDAVRAGKQWPWTHTLGPMQSRHVASPGDVTRRWAAEFPFHPVPPEGPPDRGLPPVLRPAPANRFDPVEPGYGATSESEAALAPDDGFGLYDWYGHDQSATLYPLQSDLGPLRSASPIGEGSNQGVMSLHPFARRFY